MKPITESFYNANSIKQMIDMEEVNEGLRDILKSIKTKFKQAFQFLRGVVVKLGSYFLPVDDDGEIIPAISPLTVGQAYKDGLINKTSTYVCLSKEAAKIVGLNNKLDGAKSLYGSGNSIKYWERSLNEAEENGTLANINEVKMHTDDPMAKYSIIEDDDELLHDIVAHVKNPKLAKMLIWGAPGIGKTAILMGVIDSMKSEFPDYQLVVKTLSNETPDNFTLPKYVEVNGTEKATDIPKTWLPVYKPTGDKEKDAMMDESCGRGLLFIDELSRATPQVLNVVLPLVNEGMFNGYKLGSGWSIICASNRAEDEMSGQSSIGNALANRFYQVYYEPTVKTWRKWADKQKFISPLLTQWLSMPSSENMSGGKFFYMDPNEDMDSVSPTTLMCTPRSWTNAMRELAVYSHTGSLEGFSIFDIPTRIIARTLNAYVPSSAVDSFLAFLEVIQGIGNFDAAVRGVWQKGSFKVDKKNLNKITLPLAQLICSAHADSLPTQEEFENLANWLVSQNSDQLASYTLDVFKNVFIPELVNNESAANQFFLAKKKYNVILNDPKRKEFAENFKSIYTGVLSKWGYDITNMPDYSVGLKTIATKYAAAFKDAIVDGKEALG